ncbi:MAG: LTA synthase family protein [Mesorhizobium sp.]
MAAVSHPSAKDNFRIGENGVRTGGVSTAISIAVSVLATMALATALTFLVEWISRGSFTDTVMFFSEPFRPAFATVLLFAILLVALDSVFGRSHIGALILAPIVLTLAATGHQKAYYLGDPLYPADFLYGRQIVELLPLLVRERIGTAILILIALAALAVLIPYAWINLRRRMPALSMRGRLTRALLAAPLLIFYASLLDYSTFSWTRDRLWISPMMWDQKTNYAKNGFTLAFAMNVPMAKVSAPSGYSADSVLKAGGGRLVETALPERKPDIIMVMSESFWDPTRLPGVTYSQDPIETTRSLMSGHVFSPEFGGMTANVEFEALTGFSNAFLPYGSIPYQQYVRGHVPTMPSFLKNQGYETVAIHPFEGWFWNRKEVYSSFGFDEFRSIENLPPLGKRGLLTSDEALMGEIVARAEAAEKPLFLFAVTLQNHGPYEPGRYGAETIKVSGAPDDQTRGSIATFAEGMADSDRSLKQLIEWAQKRDRPTVIAYFGDHLPPLGPAYVSTGFLPNNVAPRQAPLAEMKTYRETPLVIWSNRKGVAKDVGTVSPAFLPMLVLKHGDIAHPFYTGILGRLHDAYPIVDRHVLGAPNGRETKDWTQGKVIDQLVERQRLMQYDIMFGDKHGEKRYFPKRSVMGPLIAGPLRGPDLRALGFPALISAANPV